MRIIFTTFLVLFVTATVSAQVVFRSIQAVGGDENSEGLPTVIDAPLVGSAMSFSFHGHMPDDPLSLLRQKQFQEELELSKDQIAVVDELKQDIQRQSREIFKAQAKFGGDAARMMETANKAIRENIEKELTGILAPHQLKRLGQLEVQMKIRNRGALALTSTKLAGALEISDEQEKEIRQRDREMQQDLEKEIKNLREKYRSDLIKDLLSKDQLGKLEELSGDDYEVKQPNIRRSLHRVD